MVLFVCTMVNTSVMVPLCLAYCPQDMELIPGNLDFQVKKPVGGADGDSFEWVTVTEKMRKKLTDGVKLTADKGL